jgi:histidinol dehydrogenase
VGIDGIQGPSEVLIIADASANPAFCAADLLAQAEHDTLASAILVTTSKKTAEETNQQIEKQLAELPRKSIASESLKNQGLIALISNLEEAVALANFYAPEHLGLMVNSPEEYVPQLKNAGCIFTGLNSTVVLGDYVAGPSHVLPTSGTARFTSPLNVFDFLKITNVISENEAALKALGASAQALAHAEGLDAHARAIEKRLRQIK